MRNYQKLHYDNYYLMNEDGTTVLCDRKTCFAPPEQLTDTSYIQRWFYDPEAGYAVRLSRNAHGDAIGRRCMADLKKNERTQERRAGQVSLDKPRFNSEGDDMGGIPEEALKIATDLDMTGAQARWDEFAANPGAITTEAIIAGYQENEETVRVQPKVDAFISSYTEIPEGASTASAPAPRCAAR